VCKCVYVCGVCVLKTNEQLGNRKYSITGGIGTKLLFNNYFDNTQLYNNR